jgi:hypothetical protein
VVQLAKASQLGQVSVRAQAISQEANRKFSVTEGEFYDLTRFWEITPSLGAAPLLVAEMDAQQVAPRIYVRSKTGNTRLEELEGDNELYFDLLKIRGSYYVLGVAFGEAFTKLWAFTADRRLKQLCTFRQAPDPAVRMVKGMDQPICKGAASERGTYVNFSEHHFIETLPDDDRFWAKSPVAGLAKADIDNDGKPDKIIRLEFLPGNGRQCDTVFLAVTDERGTTVPDNALNRALANMDECVPVRDPSQIGVLMLGKTAYVDARGWVGDRTIYRVISEKLETVCKFRGRVVNEVD